MRPMRRWALHPIGLLLFAAFLSTFPALARANGGPVEDWGGNNIVPVNTDDVQLVREEVTVNLDSPVGANTVSCRYLLRNLIRHEKAFSMSFIRGRQPGRKFRVWTGGHATPVRWMPADQERWAEYANGDLDSLPVWEVTIPAEDTLSVCCSYPVLFDGDRSGSGKKYIFQYLTTSAALWAGSIERADFRIDLGDDWRLFTCDNYLVAPYISARIEPPGFRWDGSSVLWHFENWEPEENLMIARFDAHALHSEDFLECWSMSEVDCDYPLKLPPYASDSTLLSETALLEVVRGAFLQQWAAEPVHENYPSFARICLEGLCNEIAARRGARFTDGRWQRFFEAQYWYSSNPSYEPSLLSATERANERVLLDLSRRIEGQPSLLLPLPSRSGSWWTAAD